MRFTKTIFFILAAITTSMMSCYKDTGNYDYKEINQINFGGINAAYTVLLGEKFTLKPDLKFTQDNGNDTSAYTYEWVGLRTDNVLPADQRRLISAYRNIDQIITLSPGPYRVYYRVTR